MSKKLSLRRARFRQPSRSAPLSVDHSIQPEPKLTGAERIKRSNTFFLVELIVICAAIGGLWFSWDEARRSRALTEETLVEIKDTRFERVIQVYNTATHPQTAPEARIKALRFLIDQGESLVGIDLSCEAIGSYEVSPDAVEGKTFYCRQAPNLRFADLSFADLRYASFLAARLTGANLAGANMIGAILTLADLRRANLGNANLVGARLSGAILVDANLIGARLSVANLSGANLSDANLGEADLIKADLSAANLSNAKFKGALLSGANLSGVWAWSDRMPTDLPDDVKILRCVFNPDGHHRWKRPDECGATASE